MGTILGVFLLQIMSWQKTFALQDIHLPFSCFRAIAGRWRWQKSSPISLTHIFCLGASGRPAGQKRRAKCFANIFFFLHVFKRRLFVNGRSFTSERWWVVVGSRRLTLAFPLNRRLSSSLQAERHDGRFLILQDLLCCLSAAGDFKGTVGTYDLLNL